MANNSKATISVHDIIAMKQRGEKITALTAYDATFARLIDEGGAEIVLVGDSLGMVIQGHSTTLPVTLDEVIYHSRACSRGVQRALLVADMPFMSYQASEEQALINSARCLKEGGAVAAKFEGGKELAETIRRVVEVGIPVMGHIGMQPQRVRSYGGYSLQGSDSAEAKKILLDAEAVAKAGAFSVVVEKVPRSLAKKITEAIPIPTLGIASGPDCDGQILVSYDMLGLADQFKFRFVRRYLELANEIRGAVGNYKDDIREGRFPSVSEWYE